MIIRALAGVTSLTLASLVFAAPPMDGPSLMVTVADTAEQHVPGVRVELRAAGAVVASALTDQSGLVTFSTLSPPLIYELSASKDGFDPVMKSGIRVAAGGVTQVTMVLVPAAHHDSVNVEAKPEPLDQDAAATATAVPAQIAKELPNRPATVADALPLVPGVVRLPDGGLQISGAAEHRSALIVNSADVTDPATGQFGLTVPIDSVESLNVYQTPFLAEYGRFSAGLVSVETRRGGDQWKWSINDPLPDFRIRSWDLRGLKDATPRLNFEGPLIKSKLYFSEGFDYDIRKIEVYELPFPQNQKKQEGYNSFSQFDWMVSGRQLITATFHAAPQSFQYVNMNYFNPEQTTPDAGTQNYTATVADHLTIGSGVLDNTLSTTEFNARVWGQGNQDLILTPEGNSGNYFAQQNRSASRLSWSSVYSFAPLNERGTHNVKVGSYLAGSWDRGQTFDRPIDILNASNALVEQIAFTGGQPYRMNDLEYAFFAQDHWLVSPHLSIDYGLRAESQAISEAFRLAPRVGVSWLPDTGLGTVVSGGFGWFYDRVPLNVYAFNQYPQEVITMFDGLGNVSAGPFLYQNALGTVAVRPPLVFQEMQAGNFSPRSTTWTMQVEQPLSHYLKLRASFMESDSSGLVVLNAVAPNPLTNIGAYLLSGTGQSRYRQFELTARVRLAGQKQLFFSYVRSRARGDLNDFNNYVGTYPIPVIQPNQFSYLPADLPNRFLAWGVIKLPAGFQIAPVVEFRTGFPYLVTDAAQNYVGVPYGNRFPDFFSVDSRFSKDIKVSPKYTMRFSISAYNLTDHFNPEAIHSNIADPAYGFLFGQRSRRYTADFDVIF